MSKILNLKKRSFMKKVLLVGFITLMSTTSFSAVIKSYDKSNSCTLFKVLSTDENGDLKLKEGEKIENDREAYGFSFKDMEIDFERKEVLVQPMINITLGFNKALIAKKVRILADNQKFNFLINQLNRNLLLLESVCISRDQTVVYSTMFENKNN